MKYHISYIPPSSSSPHLGTASQVGQLREKECKFTAQHSQDQYPALGSFWDHNDTGRN